MTDPANFDQHLSELIHRSHDRGEAVGSIISLITSFPHRAGEVVHAISYPLKQWSTQDMKNVWCALVLGHETIGQNGLTQEGWERNCRGWLAAQTQLAAQFSTDLTRLAIGYGSVVHTLRCLDIILDQARDWHGLAGVHQVGAGLAEPALAHCLDGRHKEGPVLLDQLCQRLDMGKTVGTREKMNWVPLWARMAMDGQSLEYIEQTLDILITHGAKLNAWDNSGITTLAWVSRQKLDPQTSDADCVAGIVGSLLAHSWPVSEVLEAGLGYGVIQKLEKHPSIKREKLLTIGGKRKQLPHDNDDQFYM